MAINSVKSNALEPTRSELRQLSLAGRIVRLLPVYGLVILTVLLAVLFSFLLPNTFPTMLNARSIISDKAVIAILSLAAMIPMVTGKIDLTIGYGIVLWHMLVISLQEWFFVPWPLAVLIVLCLGGRLACSTAFSSKSPRSTASSPRSAPAPCSMRSPCGTRRATRSWGHCRTGSSPSAAPACWVCR